MKQRFEELHPCDPIDHAVVDLDDKREGVVLHAFDGKAPFNERTLEVIAGLKEIYGLDLDSADSHNLEESE